MLKDKVRRTQEKSGSLSDDQKIAIIKIELKIGRSDVLSETAGSTLAYIASIVEDRDACRALQKTEQVMGNHIWNPASAGAASCMCRR